MARLLALEWDGREARVVVANRRGRQLVFEDAFCIDLGSSTADGDSADLQIGKVVGAELRARSIGRAETLVAVGRASIELRNLQLPMAPEHEIPDLVRFQALRQFTALDEDWPLDYFKVDVGQVDVCHVLAAAISPNLVSQIESNCRAADLRPTRLVLRPCAAASLLRRRTPGDERHVRLLIDLLTDEADLTVLDDESIVFTRTVRLGEETDSPEQGAALVREVRRTMLAVQNQVGGLRVEQVILCGDSEDHGSTCSRLESELSLSVDVFNPFDSLSLSSGLRKSPPKHPGRFAPLIGILLDHAEDHPPAIDFLNPREAASPPTRRVSMPLAVATAATLLLAVVAGFYLWSTSDADRLQKLNGDARKLEKQLKALEQTVKNRETIRTWTSGDVHWIDELDYLSTEFPPATKAIVTHFQGSSRTVGGGRIQLKGYATDAGTIVAMERALRDDRHDVFGDGSEADDKREKYRWRFTDRIDIKPRLDDSEARPE